MDICQWSDVYHLTALKQTCFSVIVMRAWEEDAKGVLSEGLWQELEEFKRGLARAGEEGHETKEAS